MVRVVHPRPDLPPRPRPPPLLHPHPDPHPARPGRARRLPRGHRAGSHAAATRSPSSRSTPPATASAVAARRSFRVREGSNRSRTSRSDGYAGYSGTFGDRAGEPGFEPDLARPKPAVLPVTPLPNGVERRYQRRGPASGPSPRGTRPASAPRSWAGPPGAGMPSTRIALRPSDEALAAVGRADVEAAQLAHALEAVADRVAVGEELLGGAGDVAVGVEERLERAHQLGLVLLVVGDAAARRSRRGSAAARPGPRSSRAAAAGRRRSPRTTSERRPRASATFAASSASAPARWRSAGSRRRAAERDGDRVAGQAAVELAQDRRRPRARRLGPSPGHDDHELAIGALPAPRPAAAAGGPARRRRERERARSPRAPRSATRQHARAPVALLGLLRAGARDEHARARGRGRSRAPAARARMFSRSVTRRPRRSARKSPTAASLARSGASVRSTSSAIRLRDHAQQRPAAGSPRAR